MTGTSTVCIVHEWEAGDEQIASGGVLHEDCRYGKILSGNIQRL